MPSYNICEMAVQENELVVLESHLLENEDFFDQILKFCWSKKCQLCLSVGTSEHFNKHNNQEKIEKLIHQERIHYLFLKGKADQEQQEQELLKTLSPILKGFVVNRSLLGCILYHEGQMIKIPWPSGPIVDMTGIHDALVAGYLWAAIHKLNPVQSAQCGILAAQALRQVVGTKLTPEQVTSLSQRMTSVGQRSYKTVE